MVNIKNAASADREPGGGFSMKERLNYDEKQESNIPVR